MKAWILEDAKKLKMQEFPPTEIKEDEIKVKVEEVLLSNFDYEVYSGASKRKYPFILGRYAVGVVSQVGDPENTFFQKMDRVAIEPYVFCEECAECKKERYDHCANMQELGYNTDGLLRNFADLHYSQLHRLPDSLSNDKALYVSQVAFCLNVVDALNLEKGRHIAIFSSSKTGLILAQLIAYYQAVPVLISDRQELLQAARELGIFYNFDVAKTDVEKELTLITGGRKCSEIIYCSNGDFNFKDIYDVAATNANICLAGYSNRESKISVAQICKKHLNIFGVYNGAGSYSSAINMLVTGTVNVDPLMGKQINFDRFDAEMAAIKLDDLYLKSPVIKIN
ncbi:MAG: alcohol dehydrogenase catalytic domain-containing protein [Clostridiales bacterium]|nr:alcohol dehydrogenase catalytic domain-containing protein [Clostridiales bacterium]